MHRLVQEAFLYGLSPKERQKYFDAAVSIVEKVFPRQVNGNPFHNRWEECRAAIQHGMSLANRFAELKRFKLSLNPSAAFVELLKNCARFVFLYFGNSIRLIVMSIGISLRCPIITAASNCLKLHILLARIKTQYYMLTSKI